MPIQLDPNFIPSVPPIVSPPQPDPNRSFSIQLIGSDDNIALTTRDPMLSGFFLTRGSLGLDMPPLDVFSDPLASSDGDYFRGMRFKNREIFLPILTYGQNQPLARTAQRRLFALINPKKGFVTLRVSQYDGSTREIRGIYSGGAEGNWGSSSWFKWWNLIGINLRCFDPYFVGTDVTSQTFRIGEDASPLLGTGHNFFPMVLSSAELDFGAVPYNNPGDVEAFPTWTINGPMSDITISIDETGESFELGSITSGHSLIVNTARPNQTVKDETGANKWDKLTPESSLFSLPPGNFTISIVATDITDVSSVTLNWQARYLAA